MNAKTETKKLANRLYELLISLPDDFDVDDLATCDDATRATYRRSIEEAGDLSNRLRMPTVDRNDLYADVCAYIAREVCHHTLIEALEEADLIVPELSDEM